MSARDSILNAVRSGLGNAKVDPAAVRRDADALPHQGFITVYTDVTEQRRAAEQISRHQAELEEHIASRTEALTRANRELTAAVDSNRAITQALRRSEQRLREITDAIPAAIAYVDKDRIYRYANKGYAPISGGSR